MIRLPLSPAGARLFAPSGARVIGETFAPNDGLLTAQNGAAAFTLIDGTAELTGASAQGYTDLFWVIATYQGGTQSAALHCTVTYDMGNINLTITNGQSGDSSSVVAYIVFVSSGGFI